MSRVGIIAALPGELKPLVQGWKPMPLPGTRKGEAAWVSHVDGVECVAVCAGVGSEAAAHACAIAAQGGALDAIVSVGWSGALSCGIFPGNAYAVNEVIDALTGEYFATNFPLPHDTGVPMRLVTTDHIIQYAEKRRLAGLYQAVMDVLPDFGRYTDADGHLRVAALLGHVAVRPKYWPAMARMGQNAKRGAVAVAGALRPLIGEA
jgi:adenosylhomocysteine nucleosidase